MKQFNLDEYLKTPSKKIVTRDGKNARIVCTDVKGTFPIVALIENFDGSNETAYKFKKNGHFLDSDDDYLLDLFFAPEKHEGWVNVHRSLGLVDLWCRCIFDSEEEARRNADETAVATVKIEWEE